LEPVFTNHGVNVLPLEATPTMYAKFPMNTKKKKMVRGEIAKWNADINFIYFVVLTEYAIIHLAKISVYVILYIV
jgi:hypothetical protein